MSYDFKSIALLRFSAFQTLKQEMQATQGNDKMPDSLVPLELVEMRVQTAVMAGLGAKPDERKTSPEMAKLAAKYMNDANPEVKRMAASLISQA